jgi:hypothetical protein
VRAKVFAPVAAVCLATIAWCGPLRAESLSIPNASFEGPTTTFVSIAVNSWQKVAKPAWYQEAPPAFTWTQLIGIFKNTSPSSPDHLDNIDGNQALWLFAVPEVELFQDYSVNAAFDQTFQVGKSYDLTVAVLGSGGGMREGATLDLSLYYRDGGGNKVPFATTTVVHSVETFPTNTHFKDFVVRTPVVKAGDPWAGKKIGIRLLSTIPNLPEDDPDYMGGGYWDLDNVRLTSSVGGDLTPTKDGTNLRLTWPAATGWNYQLKVTGDFITWTDYGTLRAGTGSDLFTLIPFSSFGKAFFRLDVTAAP